MREMNYKEMLEAYRKATKTNGRYEENNSCKKYYFAKKCGGGTMSKRSVYVCNTFTPTMLLKSKKAKIEIEELELEEWVEYLQFLIANGCEPKSYIGHAGTARLYADLLGPFAYPGCEEPHRGQLLLEERDELYVITLKERLPEGKVLNEDEIRSLYREGKIVFYKVVVVEACPKQE